MQQELLKKVVAELAERLPNARVAKIHQPAADILSFRLWTGQENLRLLISAEPASCRLHLTTAELPNPYTPPRFCQLLRARVTRILAIQLLNDDRIVSLRCSGPKGETFLLVELTGRRSNILLLDAGMVIIDALHRVAGEGSLRHLAAGQLYRLPEKKLLEAAASVDAFLVPAGQSASRMVEEFYLAGQGAESKTDLRALITKSVVKKRKKLLRRLESIAVEAQRQSDAELFKQAGELLLANLFLLRRGMETVEILNYYLQPPATTTILLNPRLSPADNAAQYFKRYKKARHGLQHSQRRAQETQNELYWLDSIDYSLHEAFSAVAIEEIAAECRQAGLLQASRDRFVHKPVNQKSVPLETRSPSGFKVICGRNNRQNDYVSTRLLDSADLWFHAYQCPGAHVVLKGVGPLVCAPESDLLFAAALAAGYSRRRGDTKVDVMAAEPQHVSKPKGGQPGLVLVRKYKTLLVKPLRLD